MIRAIGILIGLGFTAAVLWALLWGVVAVGPVLSEHNRFVEPTVEHVYHREPKALHLASDGLFGKWDLQQLQRGYQVYKEVCSACHSLNYVAFRDLGQLGYNEAQVKALAAEWTVPDLNPDTGEATTRPGKPTDYFPSPHANAIMAAAAGNPPDLSLMTKARHGGAPYVYSILTGYQAQPAALVQRFPDAKTPDGLNYNPYFANLNIRMPPPLSANQVTYADGTEATVEQMAEDVSAFLVWTAEPTLVKRTQTGWAVLGFLIFATVLAWLAKKQVWAPVTPNRPKKG